MENIDKKERAMWCMTSNKNKNAICSMGLEGWSPFMIDINDSSVILH